MFSNDVAVNFDKFNPFDNFVSNHNKKNISMRKNDM